MRIAQLTDLHILSGPRFDEHRRVFLELVDRIEAAGVDLVVCNGDNYGHRTGHRSSPEEQGLFYGGIRRILARSSVVAIPGNHEAKGELETLPELAGQWPIEYRDRAEVVQVMTPAGPASVYCIPYPSASWLAQADQDLSWAQLRDLADQKLGSLLKLWALRIRGARRSSPHEPQILITHTNLRGSRTSGGEVMANREIELVKEELEAAAFDLGLHGHIHLRQWPALGHVIGGSPWFNTHGEEGRDPSFTIADIGEPGESVADLFDGAELELSDHTPGGLPRQVWRIPTGCRRFVTLDWEWGRLQGGDLGWVKQPTAKELADAVGAEVRPRLEGPQELIAACPWGEVLEGLVGRGAAALRPSVKAIPSVRVREEAVSQAPTLEAQLRAFWSSQEPPPDETMQDAALALLGELVRRGETFPEWLQGRI